MIRILPLYGSPVECKSLDEAIRFIESYGAASDSHPFVRYEVHTRYDNGDKVEGDLASKEGVIDFLAKFQISGEADPIEPKSASH